MKGKKDEDPEEMNPLNTIFKSVVPSFELTSRGSVVLHGEIQINYEMISREISY